jgi:UDP-N-acetylmuramate dehydrogenase
VFKNPPGRFAGQLIETAGLKGTSVGDVQISEKHGNFFVNRGRATAADLLALIRIAQRRVEEVHNVHLEPEILMLGDWDREELADL